MAQSTQKIEKRHIYITKWPDERERYIKYDSSRHAFLHVNLDQAQRFESREDAEDFAETVAASEGSRPQVVPVEIKTIA